MIWWWRTHRPLVLIIGIVVPAVAVSVSGGFGLLFPSLGGTSPFTSVPLSGVLSLATVVVLAYTTSDAARPVSSSATRPLRLLDLALICASIVVGSVTAAGVSSLVGHAGLGPVYARNLIGLVGVLLISRRLIGRRLQAVPAVLYVFVAAIFGRDGLGTIAAWAWPVDRSNDSVYAILPLALAAVGIALVLTSPAANQRLPADSNA